MSANAGYMLASEDGNGDMKLEKSNIRPSQLRIKVAAIAAILVVVLLIAIILETEVHAEPEPGPEPITENVFTYTYTLENVILPSGILSGRMSGITVSQHDLYIVDDGQVHVFAQDDWSYKGPIAGPVSAHGIMFSHRTDTLWVADQGLGLNGPYSTSGCGLRQYSTAGTLLTIIGEGNCTGTTDPLQLNMPTSVEEDSWGALYVIEGHGVTHRMTKIDSDSNVLWLVGDPGWVPSDGKQSFNLAHDVAYDPLHDRVLVADRNNNRIKIHNAEDGAYLGEMVCLALDNPQSVVVQSQLGLLLVLTGAIDHAEMGYLHIMALPDHLYEHNECTILETIELGVGVDPLFISQHPSFGDVFISFSQPDQQPFARFRLQRV